MFLVGNGDDPHTGPPGGDHPNDRIFENNAAAGFDTEIPGGPQKDRGVRFSVSLVERRAPDGKPVENAQPFECGVDQSGTGGGGDRRATTDGLDDVQCMADTGHGCTLATHQLEHPVLDTGLHLGRRRAFPRATLEPQGDDGVAAHTHRRTAVVIGQIEADSGEDFSLGLPPQGLRIDQKSVKVEDCRPVVRCHPPVPLVPPQMRIVVL